MSGVKAYELRKKTKEELLAELSQYRTELAQLRVVKSAQSSSNKTPRIRIVRKTIARILTVINQQQKLNMRKFYKNKKFKPKELRVKKTRAIRRALTKHQSTRLSLKEWKRRIHFPIRKFALKSEA